MELNEDAKSAADKPVLDMLAKAGIDINQVTARPDGIWDLAIGDTLICFGPATTETGEATDPETGVAVEGWDWTKYTRLAACGSFTGQDWSETDEEMLGILKDAARAEQQS